MKAKTYNVLRLVIFVTIIIGTFSFANAQNATEKPKPHNASQAVVPPSSEAADSALGDSLAADSLTVDTAATAQEVTAEQLLPLESDGMFKSLKKKFIDGSPGYMSLVAIALVLGLAFCIERIIFLTLASVDTNRLMDDLTKRIESRDIEGALQLCNETHGPVASLCEEGLQRIDEDIETIERAITAHGTLQAASLEKGCSWITLFISMAPALGFLGTVIGMVIAFDQIQMAGDISPTIVASGMKVALITTIFGIIVALILQLFYNYILTKIERLTFEMEEAAILILDQIVKYKQNR